MTDCELCELQQSLIDAGEDVDLGDGWRINVFQGESVRPRYVMQPRQHASSLHDLDAEVLGTMGPAMARVEERLLAHPKVERVYFEIYGETEPGHPHIHVVPRFLGETPVGPHRDPDREAPEGFDLYRELLRMRSGTGEGGRGSRGGGPTPRIVSAVVGAVGWWRGHLSLEQVFKWLVGRFAWTPSDYAPFMLQASLALLAGLALVASLPLPDGVTAAAAWVGFGFGLWRTLDILMFIAGFVLDTADYRIKDPARSIISFVLNAVEVLLACVLGLRALGLDVSEAWRGAASVLAPVDPVDLGSWPANLWIVAVTVVVVLAVATGIGVVVGTLVKGLKPPQSS